MKGEDPPLLSALYDKDMNRLLAGLFERCPHTRLTPYTVLEDPFVRRFLKEEEVRGQINVELQERALGKPFDSYDEEYD